MKFETVSIGSVCEKVYSGGTPKSTVSEYYIDGNIPWLNTKEISFNRIRNTERRITELGLKNSSAKWVYPPAVIIAMYGVTAGNVATSHIPLTTNQACCNLLLDRNKADYRFVYYYIQWKYKEISGLANGGAQQNLNARQIKDFPISLPNLQLQHEIADVLWTIDDKIEINNAINRNLEEQAKAIYQNIAKKSEVEAPLSNFISIKHGYAFKGDFIQQDDNNVVLVTPGNFKIGGGFQESKCKYFSAEYPQDFVLPSGTLVVTMTDLSKDADTLGYGAIIPQNPQRIYLHNQRIGRVEELNDILPKDYIYWYMRSYKYHHQIVGSASGSTVKHTSPKRILEQQIPIPNREDRNMLEAIANLDTQISYNDTTNIHLRKIRDTLLPRLMSGEIDISSIEI